MNDRNYCAVVAPAALPVVSAAFLPPFLAPFLPPRLPAFFPFLPPFLPAFRAFLPALVWVSADGSAALFFAVSAATACAFFSRHGRTEHCGGHCKRCNQYKCEQTGHSSCPSIKTGYKQCWLYSLTSIILLYEFTIAIISRIHVYQRYRHTVA
jgi:hypothetical protein